MFSSATAKPHIQYHPVSLTVMPLQSGTRKKVCCSLESFFCSYVAYDTARGWGRCKPFIPHKPLLRPEVLKICFALLFRSVSEEEYETQNGHNRCSSSTALQTIAINQFSWTDSLDLGYHVDTKAFVFRYCIAWSMPQWNQINICLRLLPNTEKSHHVISLRHSKWRKWTQLMSKPFCLINSTFRSSSNSTKHKILITN